MERLARGGAAAAGAAAALLREPERSGEQAVARGMPQYLKLFESARDGQVAPEIAPIPEDQAARAHNVKAGIYFLDSNLSGICEIPDGAWTAKEHPEQRYAVVILNEFAKAPEQGTLEAGWITGTQGARAELRAAEVAVVTAGYIRNLGFSARAHFAGASEVDMNRLAVHAGIALEKDGVLTNPFTGSGFRLAVVTTHALFNSVMFGLQWLSELSGPAP